jgi:hypothetical protein
MTRNSDRINEIPQAYNINPQQEEPMSLPRPTFFVDLPSKGLFYGEKSSLYQKSSLELYHLTGKHEDILNNKDFIKKNVVFDKLLSALLVDKSIKLDELLIGDKNALVFSARINGFDADYSVEVVCPECEKKDEHVFDLQKCFEKPAGNLEKISPDGTFEVIVPKTQKKITCKLISSGDRKEIEAQIEKHKQFFKEDKTSSIEVSSFVVSIDGKTNREVIDAELDNLPAKDIRALKREYSQVVPSIVMDQDYSCKSCGFESKMIIPFSVGFFWG